MSWRSGSALFIDIWPAIQKHIHDREHRVEFTASLLRLFTHDDMDPYDVEDTHPEVRAAMRLAGIELAEPERYNDDVLSSSASNKRKPSWWHFWR